MAQEESKSLSILKRSSIKSYVKLVEKFTQPRLFFVRLITVRLQEKRAKHGAKGKRVYCRNNNCNNKRNPKLFVEHPCSSFYKGNGHKHRCHYEGNRNNSPCNFVHCRNSSRFRFFVSMFHFGVYRLNHHYSIIHHNTYGKY